jgi:hypothetical protein
MNELKPCPFCGGESLLRDLYINGVANTKHYTSDNFYCANGKQLNKESEGKEVDDC